MLNKKVSLSNLLLSSVICSAVTFIACYNKFKHSGIQSANAASVRANTVPTSCGSVAHRLEGYKFVKPLLWGDKTCESANYAELKSELVNEIDIYKRNGAIDDASIYLKVFDKGEFLSINENEMFHPGSLIKLPILITYLTMEEKNPGVLNRKLVFNLPPGGVPRQTYNSNQIKPGESYTIKELLRYMIAYSDNNATYMLNQNVDLDAFKRMFADFGLPVPDVRDLNYQITAKDYSSFLKVIYNAGYLTTNNSEYAAELLNQCDFNDGIVKGLPSNVQIAHKFGEWGDRTNPNVHQLSESAIVYLDNSPYLITVMTKGKDVKRLPEVISNISKIAFKSIKEKEIASL